MNIIKKAKYMLQKEVTFIEKDLKDKIHVQLHVDNKRVSGSYLMKRALTESSVNELKEGLILRYLIDNGFSFI